MKFKTVSIPKLSKSNKTGEIRNIKECPLCGTDGELQGNIINDHTYMWSCTTCPAILFEYHNLKDTEYLYTYLERTSVRETGGE